jgi:cytochrome d ubiquinol oxidase subunit II
MVASGAMVSAAAWFEDVPWFGALAERPALWAIVAVATTSVVVVFRLVDTDRVWTVRAASGVTIAAILGGYFGAVYPVALEIRGHAPLTWHDGRAPESALDALALALLAGSILILPGLFWLYRVFKRPA